MLQHTNREHRLLISHRRSAVKMLNYFKYQKVIQKIKGEDRLVRRTIVKCHIHSSKLKEISVDITRLVILAKLTKNANDNIN